jgi:putative holliday junction resolvase
VDAPNPRERTRILALDVGKKRIGLAITDELGLMAHGLPTFERTKPRQDVARLAELAEENGVGLFLVGLPLHMDGASSPQAEAAREFGYRLHARSRIQVKFWDERLTSIEAEQHLKARGEVGNRSEGDVDRIAAIILLEDYLASLPRPS